MDTIEHRGYVGSVESSAEDECFFVSVEGLDKDVLMTEAEDAAGLKSNFERIIDEYFADCARLGREPAV